MSDDQTVADLREAARFMRQQNAGAWMLAASLDRIADAIADGDWIVDDRRVRLVPMGSWCRIWNPDGSLRCNHGDRDECGLNGHETTQLYEIVVQP